MQKQGGLERVSPCASVKWVRSMSFWRWLGCCRFWQENFHSAKARLLGLEVGKARFDKWWKVWWTWLLLEVAFWTEFSNAKSENGCWLLFQKVTEHNDPKKRPCCFCVAGGFLNSTCKLDKMPSKSVFATVGIGWSAATVLSWQKNPPPTCCFRSC